MRQRISLLLSFRNADMYYIGWSADRTNVFRTALNELEHIQLTIYVIYNDRYAKLQNKSNKFQINIPTNVWNDRLLNVRAHHAIWHLNSGICLDYHKPKLYKSKIVIEFSAVFDKVFFTFLLGAFLWLDDYHSIFNMISVRVIAFELIY